MNPINQENKKALTKIVGNKNTLTDDLSLIAYAADAGCYRKIPQLIAKPENQDQVIQLLKHTYKNKINVTFRAAGTSLSGQALSDSVLLQARGDNWNTVDVSENGKYVTVQPGITGTRLNQILKPYGVKFGPDPASINSALIGGIIANNASGMSCGIHANSYATIQSAKIIFADGTLLDTSSDESRKNFIQKKKDWITKIIELRNRIHNNPEMLKKINKKYTIKNTTGYSLKAFTDFENPIDILMHLMVGSEGTLGFIAEATFITIPDLPLKASAIIYFKTLKDACDAVPKLKAAKVSAIELIDRKALQSVENQSGIPDFIKTFDAHATALLIDLEAKHDADLDKLIAHAKQAISQFELLTDFEITKDPKQIANYWKIRKGIFPSVGGMRKPGTTVIIEDVAVSMNHLTSAVLDLRDLLDNNGYGDAVIYGHALEGNLHFIFSQDFNKPTERNAYEKLIDAVCTLIVKKYDGSLKAEHGTGMNMAPFVAFEWGNDLYQIMREIKQTFDPDSLLNPDVIITDDKKLHLKNFKPIHLVDETIDPCIECGFCEINCLTNGYTLSARQRIVVQREIQRLTASGENKTKLNNLNKSYQFMGVDSCAGDGLCAITCPLSIDTGAFIKKYRNQKNLTKPNVTKLALRIANNFDTTIKLVRTGLGIVKIAQIILGSKVLASLSRFVTFITFKKLMQWHAFFPKPAKLNVTVAPDTNKKTVVYFPSCINQSMGPSYHDKDKRPLTQVTVDVLERAGYRVIFPDKMNTLCCGTPWESKGFIDIANLKSNELENALRKASENGKYPILSDTSPCIYRMKKVMDPQLKLYEPVEFAHDFLLDALTFKKSNKKVALHITCTSTKMDLQEKFLKVAHTCTSNVVVPQEVGCCGFAGDKGFTQPKMNDWALRKLKPQIEGCENGYSNSRTCEIGLSKNSGIDYKSIMYLIDETTK